MSLVVADKPLVRLAKKNMNNVVPLYYNMRKASPSIINNENLYKGLNLAFTGSNIGQYSNNITKIWNSDTFINGTEEEKQDAIDLVKLLCMEDNFHIDYAKTLYVPTRPKEIDEKIRKYTNNSVPHFFKYAKDKEDTQVKEKNKSLVNLLDDLIPNPRINCRDIDLDEIDYKLLMRNKNIEVKITFGGNGQIIDDETDPLIVKYNELNNTYRYKINMKNEDIDTTKFTSSSSLRQSVVYKNIAENIRNELSVFGYTNEQVCDILVKYLYDIKNSKHKEALWFCYGDYIYKNLSRNIKGGKKEIQCVDCGEWIYVNKKNSKSCRCDECQSIRKRKLKRENKRKERLRKSMKISK